MRRDASDPLNRAREGRVLQQIVGGEQNLLPDFLPHPIASVIAPEELPEPLLQRPEAGPVRDVFVHGPAHQAVVVLGEPQVPLGDERTAAARATVHRRPALDDPPPYSR